MMWFTKVIGLAAVVALAGGCATGRREMAAEGSGAREGTHSARVLGTSVQGRTITLHSFNEGVGGWPVLVFAGIHGDERTTVYVAERLVGMLKDEPSLVGGTWVAVVPVANPDGFAANTRTSARRVDLNRNFPATNWKSTAAGTRNYNGPSPASEPETRILIELVEKLKPVRICSIHSITRGRRQNNYDGPGQAWAELMGRHNQYAVTATIGYPTPGSFGSWAGIDRGIPVITLELDRTTEGTVAWEENREAILALVRGR